jgi:hypothetical protein
VLEAANIGGVPVHCATPHNSKDLPRKDIRPGSVVASVRQRCLLLHPKLHIQLPASYTLQYTQDRHAQAVV